MIRLKIFSRPVAVSQPRRLCAGANHPPLNHRSCSSPSAQAPRLSCSDAPLVQPPRWLASRVTLVNFRRQDVSAQFGDLGSRNWNPPKRAMNTYVQRRGHPVTLGAYSKWYPFSLEAFSPPCIVPSPFSCLSDVVLQHTFTLLLALNFDHYLQAISLPSP
jgi:hypothetical protein